MEQITTDILVAGAGPAGLTAAALLARMGLPSICVAKYSSTADSPRAHVTNQRAVEILRDLGLEERAQRRSLAPDQIGTQVFATSFAGREISRLMTWGSGADRAGEYEASSPARMCNIPQTALEPLLLDGAREFGADIRFDHEVINVRQTPDYIVAHIRRRDSGEEFEIRARYMIGCDGARTLVGEQGSFTYEGEAGLASAITVWMEADLTRYAAHRSGALFFNCVPGSEDLCSVWTVVEPFTEWNAIFARHGGEPSELDEDSVMARVREAIGDDDVQVKIKKISEWKVNHVVASNYRDGRLFIAGDAAHRHPPANGLGSNTSIQDSYNLAWKLALVLKGQAGDGLLDSYSSERQPVGRQIVDRANRSLEEMFPWFEALGFGPGMSREDALASLDALFGPGGGERRQRLLEGLDLLNGQFNAHGVEMNQRYAVGAVVGDGSPFPEFERDADLYHQPTSHPGAHIPHAWLVRGSEKISTLDLCAYDRFTLVTGIEGGLWREAALQAARETGVPLQSVVVGLGQEHNDVLGRWRSVAEIGEDGCLLVRPDRVVAWRSAGMVEDPTAALTNALSAILRPAKEQSQCSNSTTSPSRTVHRRSGERRL